MRSADGDMIGKDDMEHDIWFTDEFAAAVAAATNQARLDTLKAGVPVFYRDDSGVEVMEHPNGRKFEICYIPNAPGGRNYEILRELRDAA